MKTKSKLLWRKLVELGYFAGYLFHAHSARLYRSMSMLQRSLRLWMEKSQKQRQRLIRHLGRLRYRRTHWMSLLVQWSQFRRQHRLLQQVKRNKQADYNAFLDRASHVHQRRKAYRKTHWHNQKVKWSRQTTNITLYWKRFYKKIEPDDLY